MLAIGPFASRSLAQQTIAEKIGDLMITILSTMLVSTQAQDAIGEWGFSALRTTCLG
jgi:hypothetical protein